ncbi:hypothetical protein AAHK20_22000 [Trinickia sp. YCB016]
MRQYVGGIVTYAIHQSLREDGIPLSLRGVIPRHKKGHIPAITEPTEIAPLAEAINTATGKSILCVWTAKQSDGAVWLVDCKS